MNTTETLAEALRNLEEAARKVQSGEMPADSIDLDRRNARAVLAKLEAERAAPAGHVPEHLFFSARLRIAQRAGVGLYEETNAIIRETLAELRATSAAPDLQNIEQYRMQMAGISSAALGYWQESDSIHPDYDTVALRDVAKLYAKYDKLYKAAGHAPKPAVQGEAQDAARYRWLAAHCRSTPEHWGGRWSIVIEGPAPERQDCEDAFDAAIDAAMQAQGEAVSSNRKRAAIRKAEQDAARYRWLVTRPCDGDDTYYIATEDGSEANSDGWWALGGDLPKERADEYIDAAMQAQEGGNV